MEEKKKLIAKGIDIHGNKIEFDCTHIELWCPNNQLKELIIPEGVNTVYCQNNQLTELILPEGVTYVSCNNNQLTELIIPDSVTYLYADKKVAGLEKCIGTDVEIELY